MTATSVARPDTTEYAPFYGTYVTKVPEGDLLTILEEQRRDTQGLLENLTDARALHRYAPGKWSIKEVVGHITDAERIFAYRALRIARGDETPLPGFDENAYALAAHFDGRPLPELAAELDAVRRSTLALLRGFPGYAWIRRGTASNYGVSVRAIAYIIAGHERHHVMILRERYLK